MVGGEIGRVGVVKSPSLVWVVVVVVSSGTGVVGGSFGVVSVIMGSGVSVVNVVVVSSVSVVVISSAAPQASTGLLSKCTGQSIHEKHRSCALPLRNVLN